MQQQRKREGEKGSEGGESEQQNGGNSLGQRKDGKENANKIW